MKKLLPILSILIFSCNSDKYDFNKIEIMSYYYHYEDDSKCILDRILYSNITPNGLSQTIRKTNAKSGEIYYESKINPEILNQIITETKNKDDDYFKHLKDTTVLRIYCGPIIRFKITDKNLKTLSFTFEEGNNTQKVRTYYNLYKKLFEDTLNIRSKDDSFNLKQKEFEKFAIKRDTTEYPLPPPPSMRVKFIKPNL